MNNGKYITAKFKKKKEKEKKNLWICIASFMYNSLASVCKFFGVDNSG